jgi:hypothetical protein
VSDDQQYERHYSREERLAMPGAPSPRQRPKGFLRGNRGLVILLIDVAIIAIMAIIYRQFLFSPAYEGELSGYRFTLRGFALQSRVVAELLIEPIGGGGRAETASPQADRVYAVFRAGDGEMRLAADLTGEAATLEGAVLGSEGAEELVAEVSVGQTSLVLRRRLTRDR